MTQQELDVRQLRLLGGRLCIDFVNSVENRAGEMPEEFLSSYADVVLWGSHAGLLDDADVARLLEVAAEDEQDALRAFERAVDLREALHRALLAIATEGKPDAADLQVVASAYDRAVAHASLVPMNRRFIWNWNKADVHLDRVLWPIAFSAINLLTEGDLRRVKVCANPHGCGWLFYDGSKNLSRRWCRMEGCGSQVKMRRQYAKRRSKNAAMQND